MKARYPLILLLAVLAASLLTPAFAQTQKRPAKKQAVSRANTDDMWVVNPAPGSLPPGVTQRTYHSSA